MSSLRPHRSTFSLTSEICCASLAWFTPESHVVLPGAWVRYEVMCVE